MYHSQYQKQTHINKCLPRTRIGHQSSWFIFTVQEVDNLNSCVLLYVNVVVIDLNSTDGSIESIGPQQHSIHRIVRQTFNSFVTVSCRPI